MTVLASNVLEYSKKYLGDELSKVKSIILDMTLNHIPIADDVFEYTVESGGKGVRPRLVLLAHHAAGGNSDVALEVAASMELVHIATLLHDDVVDNSDFRRSNQSVNSKWNNKIAVLAGDYLYTKAFQRVLRATGDSLLIDLLADVTNEMSRGEFIQIWFEGNLDITESEYISMIRLKTAELLRACTRSGALLAGCSNGQVESLSEYGVNMGIAFQITDDCLDLSGNRDTIGKNVFSDVRQKKLTLPLIYSLQGKHKDELTELLENSWDNGNNDFSRLSELIEGDGSLQKAFNKAQHYSEIAKSELNNLDNSEAVDILADFADWACNREK